MPLEVADIKAAARNAPTLAYERHGLQVKRMRHGKLVGKCCCPFHEDTRPSMEIYADGGWCCYPCNQAGGNAAGDVLHFIKRRTGLSFKECIKNAAQIFGLSEGGAPVVARTPPPPKVVRDFNTLTPLAEITNPEPVRVRSGHGYWQDYFAKPNGGWGLVLRISRAKAGSPPDVAKCFPYTAGEDGRARSGGLSGKLRPLYLAQIWSLTDEEIVVVEGEKAADAVRRAGLAATTWPGGAEGFARADLSLLKGRHLIIWPDNDKAGIKAMAAFEKEVAKIAASIRRVQPLGDEKADAADFPPGVIWDIVKEAV